MNGYPDRLIEKKWRELEDVPIDYGDPEGPDGVLDTDWFVFKKGEPLIVGVWRWFDSHYKIAIDGKLRFSQWEKEGQRRTKLEVIVEDIELMYHRKDQ